MAAFCQKVRCVLAAAVLAAGLGGRAAAQSRDEDLFLRRDDLRIVPFASVDAGRSVFVTVGLKQSLVGPLDRQGFVAMETVGYGLTRERSDQPGVSLYRHTLQTSSLIGYQFSFGNAFVSAFLGPELNWEQVTENWTVQRWSEPSVGARIQGELWAHPTPDTLLTASVVAGSARGSLWSRGSAGIRLWGHMFIGPEATFYATDTYREYRVGGHLTGASLGRVDFRVSAGVQNQDDERRSSPYVGVAGHFKM